MPARGLVHDRIGEQPFEVGLESSQSVAVTEQCHSIVRVDYKGEHPVSAPSTAPERVLDEEVDGRGRRGVCHNAY